MKHICKNCDWWDNERLCQNSNKIFSDGYHNPETTNDDQLMYEYNEDGSFEVGDNFGCVHFIKKVNNEESP